MTSKYQIIYWRDIPAQVKARSGAARTARELSPRFQQAIDAAAMVSGDVGTEAYLSAWRTSEWQSYEGAAETLLDEIVARLEGEYTAERLSGLTARGGHEAANQEH
ncbi:MAG: virulence factor [Bryobacteraceae bacterium]